MADLTAINDLVKKIEHDAFERGFARGLALGMDQKSEPSGMCQCGGRLEWTGLPDSCGCRPCRCIECSKPYKAACFSCEYAGV